MSMWLRPNMDKVVLRMDAIEEVTSSGIYLPQHTQDKMRAQVVVGTILAVGIDAEKDARVGDRVVIGSYGGTDVKLDSEAYVVVGLNDIIGFIEAGDFPAD